MADKTQIMDALEALAVHCRPPIMSVEDRTRWMRDWIADLAEFPLGAIINATRKWRLSGSTKFPTAGQILPIIRESLPSDRPAAPQVWRPATEDEYRAMTVKQKIREHLILANNAADKAGPMFRNTSAGSALKRASGIHLTADQMPPEWGHWRDIERNHLQEVKRLRDYVSGEPLALAAPDHRAQESRA